MLLGGQGEGLTAELGEIKVMGGLDGGGETPPEGPDERMNDEEVETGSRDIFSGVWLSSMKGRQQLIGSDLGQFWQLGLKTREGGSSPWLLARFISPGSKEKAPKTCYLQTSETPQACPCPQFGKARGHVLETALA